MPDPTDADDPWADLYRDLEVDAASAKPADPVEPTDEEEAGVYAELTEADAEGEFEPEDAGDEGDPTAEGDGAQPGEEGPKKRRRRRRRRKKKGGQPAEGEATQPAGTDAESEPVATADADEDEPEAAEFEPESVEDGSPETAREVIANWNVPSWPEIVAGLYRPDRG
ncbi:MAG: hypothetical protein U0871_08645 [Gemmataceae bacterium]